MPPQNQFPPGFSPEVEKILREAASQPVPGRGLVVPMHAAQAAMVQQQYSGMLTGGMAAEPDVFSMPGKQKEFMERLEALMVEYKVHKLDIFWKGPFMQEGNGK